MRAAANFIGAGLGLLGALILICGLFPARTQTDIRTLTMAAMFAALCYVGFAFFQIKIPVGVLQNTQNLR